MTDAPQTEAPQTDADRVITALGSGHDDLLTLVPGLTADQLSSPSAAAEWDVSQVLGHLGSGAVIGLAVLDAALAGEPNPGMEVYRAIWARWDGMSPEERRDGFVTADGELLARYQGLDAETRADLRIDMGFLPAPVDVAAAARFRLSEFALHSWDVRVTFDDKAAVRPEAVPQLLDVTTFMIGRLGRTEALEGRELTLAVRLGDPAREFSLRLADGVALTDAPATPDAVLTTSAEAWLRLASGRLGPAHTPSDVEVTGALDLDTLRRVFPGY